MRQKKTVKYRGMRKQILALALGMCLAGSQTAYADITIVPMPFGSEMGQNAQGTPSGNLAGPGGTTGALGSGGGTGNTNVNAGSTNAGSTNAGDTGVGSTGAGSYAAEPEIAAEGAVLMDGATGKVLYGKNQDTQFSPASITKVMTALVVLERCSLNDVVTFSATATTNLESGAVSLKITEGDQLTVEQALYGLLLKSANEIGNGLAEHVAGSVSGFADLMNEKAKSLGCKNTHFANPHGLNDSTHKTTPYDMALILRAALRNQTFRTIDTTLTYEFPATKNAGARTITMGHKMMYPSDSRYYPGIIGGKTGYTSLAGNTLVTGAEKDGIQLIAVVMKSKGSHYTDTKALLDYGFENYAALTGNGSAGQNPAGPGNAGTGSAGSGSTGSGSTGTGSAGPGTISAGVPQTTAAPETIAAPQGTAAAPQGTTAAAPQGTTAAVPQETTAAAPQGAAVPQGTTAAPQTSAAGQPASGGASSGWKQESGRWYYVKDDGQRAAGEWETVDGLDYWFDSDGYMAEGWRKFTNGTWYYFKPSSGYAVKNRWVQDGGSWYYLGADGVLLTNTTTPDGYPVDANGIWIQ